MHLSREAMLLGELATYCVTMSFRVGAVSPSLAISATKPLCVCRSSMRPRADHRMAPTSTMGPNEVM
jgi:hypothetical protein